MREKMIRDSLASLKATRNRLNEAIAALEAIRDFDMTKADD